MLSYDLVIIGAGPAGLSAAVSAYDAGIRSILVIERDDRLGGILNQCIHNGFGLHTFKEELTGPEYASRFITQADERHIDRLLRTTVLDVTASHVVRAVSADRGVFSLEAKAIVLAMGCRERPRGALDIAGFRPAGVYTAGCAQKLVNVDGYLPGRRVVILGSGDIGLIMARRMIWEGASVEGVYEVMPWAGGLRRNIAQCLEDYGIPFHLETTVTRIHGRDRLEGVTVAKIDKDRTPIPGTERFVACDTLLLAVGLIPENELSRGAGVEIHPVTGGPVVNDRLQTSQPSIFAAGNVVIVYDLVDNVSHEGLKAGENAARYARGELPNTDCAIPVRGGENVRLFSPQYVLGTSDVTIYLRVARPFEHPCRVFAEPDLYSQKLRYARPGEMNEVHLKAERLRGLPKRTEIVVDVEPL